MTLRAAKWASLAIVAGLMMGDLAAAETGWSGKRPISFQRQNDLFYNYYAGPEPAGAQAQMYVSPLPVPEHVGHTYHTYQPLLPHELNHAHARSWYTYNQGSGWTRTKVRYSSAGHFLQAGRFNLGLTGFQWLNASRQ